jgi:hypothetical protein
MFVLGITAAPRHPAPHVLALVCVLFPLQIYASPAAGPLVDLSVPLIRVMTGLPMAREVPMHQLTVAEMRRRLAAEIDHELATMDAPGQVKLLSAFGFVPAHTDMRMAYLELLSQQLAAFYDTRSGSFYNVSRHAALDWLGQPVVVAHELVHAAQDQALGAQAFFDARRDNDDRTRALQWLMEGQATVVGNRVGNALGLPFPGPAGFLWGEASTVLMWTDLWKRVAELAPGLSGSAVVPRYLVDSLLSAYVEGSRFFWAVERALGQSAHTYVLCDPPQSTEEMLHPLKYLKGNDPPRRVELPKLSNARVRAEQTAGEWSLRWLLRHLGSDPDSARGWVGDRMALMSNGTVLWRVVMDEPLHAIRLAGSLAPLKQNGVNVSHQGHQVALWAGHLELSEQQLMDMMAGAPVTAHAPDPVPLHEGTCCARFPSWRQGRPCATAARYP